jgi:hypothetical protein
MMSERAVARLARPTDFAALAALAHSARASLGLPIEPEPLSVYRLLRVPLGPLRASDLIWVHQRRAAIDGLARIEVDERRDWTIIQLDAAGGALASDTRLRLLDRVVRDAGSRGSVRLHVAAADAHGSLELLRSAGFRAYADEEIFYLPARDLDLSAAAAPLRAVEPSDAHELSRAYLRVTPPDVVRAEALRDEDWARVAAGWAPRTSLSQLLHLSVTAAYVASPLGATAIDAWVQVGIAAEFGALHPNLLRLFVHPEADPAPVIAAGLAEVARRSPARGGQRGVTLAVVRSYEQGLRAALEVAGFLPLAAVRQHLRDSRRRVTAPGLVPAIG